MRWASCVLLCLCSFGFCQLSDDESIRRFCGTADAEFQKLRPSCRKGRQDYWDTRAQAAIDKYIEKGKELEATSELLKRQPNGAELTKVFAFRYLNELHEVQLATKTALVEDLGRELLNDTANERLTPVFREIEGRFALLRKKNSDDALRRAYTAFLELKRAADRLETEVPVKEAFTFEPKANAYATTPEKVITYQIHDWSAGISKVDPILGQTQRIRDTIDSTLFFLPKDPIPWLPVVTQITFLLVAMGGWVKSYHGNAYLAIGVLVIPSMLASIFLVFYSDETLWNIARQSLVPGLFILYWIAHQKGWLKGVKARFRKSRSLKEPTDVEPAASVPEDSRQE